MHGFHNKNHRLLPLFSLVLFLILFLVQVPPQAADLKFSLYVVAHSVQKWPTGAEELQQTVRRMKNLGIEKIILEIARGNQIVPVDQLRTVRDFLRTQGFRVMGGIATVPGENFGVPQQGKLTWMNFQNPKTGRDLARVMQAASPLFEELVVDDFLCTADIGPDSETARQGRSWAQYRMDLLTDSAREFLIRPAKEANPKIRMIIKYPQWYDRFHLFGYDVVRQPAQFDEVWVGTESRGQYTQRYGFVQPYEGFISVRWMRSLAGKKFRAGWFDHGDCDALDFLEQAYQTTLGGVEEIIIFNYIDMESGHPGGPLLAGHIPVLQDLAREIEENPVHGITAYKPAHSDAGGDLYLMDYIGMLGIPLIPSAHFPEKEPAIFLPTQAAKDAEIVGKLKAIMPRQPLIVLTSGFLAGAGREVAQWAGVRLPPQPTALRADKIFVGKTLQDVPQGLDLEMDLQLDQAQSLLTAQVGGKPIPFLTFRETKGVKFYVLNTHTFSQADFDAVGEVLLCPRQLGLLEIPEAWADILRRAFTQKLDIRMKAPTRVVLQPLGEKSLFLHNYNRKSVTLELAGKGIASFAPWKTPTEEIRIVPEKGELRITLPPRSRLWLRKQ